MLRRHVFVAAVFLSLMFSAVFMSWTSNAADPGKLTVVPPVASYPPDTTIYSRPAVSDEQAPAGANGSAGVKGAAPAGFLVVDIPNSGGGEPDVAINPLNLNQIVVHAGFGGWNGFASNFVSSDGGLTWITTGQIPPPPGAPNTGGCPCDVTQDWGLDGNLYGAYLTGNTDVFSASTPTLFHVFSYFLIGPNAQLTDFNGTLGGADQPWLLTNVDPIIPGQNNTYVDYDDFPAGNVRVSAAPGTSPPNFTADNVVGPFTGGGVNPGSRLANDPRTGTIYSLWQNCTAGCGGSPKTIAYQLNRSQDAGATWTLNGVPAGITVATGVTVQPTPKFGTVNALLGGIDHAAVDPTTSNVYVVFGGSNGAGGNGVGIKQITFDNATPTNAILGTQHRVSPFGVEAALPSVAVAPNGTVGVLYTSFDGFDVNAFPIYSGHFAFSTDQGVTFTDQTLLTFLSPAKDSGDPRQRVLGDYQQLKVVNDPPSGAANSGATFYGVFTGNGAALGGNTANNDAIFFKVTLAPQINLNINPVAIGSVCQGSPGSGQLEVSDTGTDELIVTSVKRTSGDPDISLASGPSFPVNISPDAHFDFTFLCSPASVGAKSATFTIASNDPASPNTLVIVTCSGQSGLSSLSVPAGLTLPPTVVQTTAACSATLGVPIANTGSCPVTITNVALSGANAADYALTGVPTLPISIAGGHQLGEGDVNTVFAPLTINRDSVASVDVTFENDPFLHTTATDHIPLCGEGDNRGVRVLVTQGGIPVPVVKSIKLQKAIAPEQDSSIFRHARLKNVPLTTIAGVAPCASYQFHAEFGGPSNPIQLKEGTYRVVVKISGQKAKIVRFAVDTCNFTPMIVVAF